MISVETSRRRNKRAHNKAMNRTARTGNDENPFARFLGRTGIEEKVEE
tara:strand:+ start:978 stop:1121 length:144 start_codon:yes stop_codon:yes gene_type:complete